MTNYDDVIKILGILAHMRETYDSHGDKVSKCVVAMTTAMNIPEEEAKQIEIGAHLHDIGKLLIQADLVNMPRELAPAERGEMQRHTTLGFEAVQAAGYSQIIQDTVHYHQEKWDGSGYPDGLEGELIPLAARIVSVCDVYEALVAHRPYREPYTHEFAKALMMSLKGKDFDPRLVDLFFDKVAVEAAPEVVE